MPWTEFCSLLSGLMPDTPLGRVVAIRAEEDKETLRHFSPEQRKIRNAWRTRAAKIDPDQYTAAMKGLEDMFRAIAKRGDAR